MNIRLTLATTVGLVLGVAAIHAAEIDTLSLWNGVADIQAFGEPGVAYVGQSFVALDSVVESVSFMLDGLDEIGPIVGDTTEFHLLLTPLAGNNDRPDFDSILFESQDLSTSLDTGFELFSVDLNTQLVAGERYMWVLDALVLFDGEDGYAGVAANTFGEPETYTDGEHFFFRVDQSMSQDRSQHDDDPWSTYGSGRDLAFRMTFIPEPSSLCLIVLGVASLGCRVHKRTLQ